MCNRLNVHEGQPPKGLFKHSSVSAQLSDETMNGLVTDLYFSANVLEQLSVVLESLRIDKLCDRWISDSG